MIERVLLSQTRIAVLVPADKAVCLEWIRLIMFNLRSLCKVYTHTRHKGSLRMILLLLLPRGLTFYKTSVYRITFHRITSIQITSYRITSHKISSHSILFRGITFYRILFCKNLFMG